MRSSYEFRDEFRVFAAVSSCNVLGLQDLERKEAELYSAEETVLQKSQQLSLTFEEKKGELELSRRHAEEKAAIAEGRTSALQKDLQAARCCLL